MWRFAQCDEVDNTMFHLQYCCALAVENCDAVRAPCLVGGQPSGEYY